MTSGSVTVNYENVYTIHFTASDPEGDALTVVPTRERGLDQLR